MGRGIVLSKVVELFIREEAVTALVMSPEGMQLIRELGSEVNKSMSHSPKLFELVASPTAI